MTLAVFAGCVLVYLAVGVCLGWQRVKELFAWGRRHGAPVHGVRSLAPHEFAMWMLFWPIRGSGLFLSRIYHGLLDRAEAGSYSRAEQIARLEEQIRKED